MHLVSRRAQVGPHPAVPTSRCAFAEGESIWTESSYKYSGEQVALMGDNAGFDLRQQWLDTDARFALTLFAAR